MKMYGAPLALGMLVSTSMLKADAPQTAPVKTQSAQQGKETMKEAPKLQTKVLSPAKDPQAKSPQKGDLVTVHYTGWLADKDGNPMMDKKFDSSVDRGTPFQFKIGIGQVIKGWDEGVARMKVGEKCRLTIPSPLAYGPRSMGHLIPANSDLVFDVELLKVS